MDLQGAGKYLFDYMLRDEGIPVSHFAIDRPSDKFIFFLRKHYQLTKVLPQVNNFVLFDGFFKERSGKLITHSQYVLLIKCLIPHPDYQGKKKRWDGLDQTTEIHHVAHPKEVHSRMEDSLEYNNEPLIHLRNGGQLPTDYMQRRHISSMDQIFQTQTNGNVRNADSNGSGNGHTTQHHNFM
jgi:hypothetical protein